MSGTSHNGALRARSVGTRLNRPKRCQTTQKHEVTISPVFRRITPKALSQKVTFLQPETKTPTSFQSKPMSCGLAPRPNKSSGRRTQRALRRTARLHLWQAPHVPHMPRVRDTRNQLREDAQDARVRGVFVSVRRARGSASLAACASPTATAQRVGISHVFPSPARLKASPARHENAAHRKEPARIWWRAPRCGFIGRNA